MPKSKTNTDLKQNPRCPKCGGQFAAEGEFYRCLPVGFGFAGSGKFQVDSVEIRGYKGFCLKCPYEGEMEYSRKIVTKYPESINKKLEAAR